MPTATTNANAKHGAISTRKQPCALLQYVTSLTSAEHHPQIPPRRQFFYQPIVEFAFPLARQEFDNLLAALKYFGAVAPLAIDCISKRYFLGVARIPPIFCPANLLNGCFKGEGRNGRMNPGHFSSPALLRLRRCPNGLAKRQAGGDDPARG